MFDANSGAQHEQTNRLNCLLTVSGLEMAPGPQSLGSEWARDRAMVATISRANVRAAAESGGDHDFMLHARCFWGGCILSRSRTGFFSRQILRNWPNFS